MGKQLRHHAIEWWEDPWEEVEEFEPNPLPSVAHEPLPCNECKHHDRCRDKQLACREFLSWTSTGVMPYFYEYHGAPPILVVSEPTRGWYKRMSRGV
jgi:hypothetical protein